MARREEACPGCPWRRRWESPCGQWRFRSGSGLSELPPPPPPGEGRPPPACAQRLTQPQSRQSANTVVPALPSFPGPSPSPPLARSALLSPTPTPRARAIPGQETPWRRVGPNSSPAASRECRAPQPGPRPRQRLGQADLAHQDCIISGRMAKVHSLSTKTV
ncbi:Ubiquitin Carboxyl-Terminal Hydrolase Isozyme L1 [Manis pentadactyla]|nr:Ubiquitin Carboxyl-Terminal Hydrolase Isozyme L1 [Manis pentadactyla]